MQTGIVHPISTMPGERVEHTYAGPMEAETVHFIEAVACDRPVLVTPEQARQVMEVYIAADLSAERNEPVSCRCPNRARLRLPPGRALRNNRARSDSRSSAQDAWVSFVESLPRVIPRSNG
jgi:hypothetical protein